MLKTGTTTRSRKQISDELDKIKTDISFTGETGALTVNINTDREHLPAALAILDDILRNPAFDSVEFTKAIIDRRTAAEAGKSEPSNIASEKLGKMVSPYPKGHPYYVFSTDETIAELDALKLQDVKQFYKDFYGGENSIAAFVGEFDRQQVTGFLEKTIGSWKSASPYKEVARVYFPVKGTTETINTPDKANAMLLGAMNLEISRKHKDYPAVLMANELLGGGAFLSSRIPVRLRENEGMSYGAGSFMNIQYKYNSGSWGVYAFFNPAYKGRLDSALHEEVDKAIRDGFTADELKKSITSWEEQNRTSLGSNENLASILRSFLANDRDLLEYSQFEEKIKALTLQQVNTALKTYFDKSKLVMVYGGDFEKKDADGKPVEKKGF
jgi:zinc protease